MLESATCWMLEPISQLTAKLPALSRLCVPDTVGFGGIEALKPELGSCAFKGLQGNLFAEPSDNKGSCNYIRNTSDNATSEEHVPLP